MREALSWDGARHFNLIPCKIFQKQNPYIIEYLLEISPLRCEIAPSTKHYQQILLFTAVHSMGVSWRRFLPISLNFFPFQRHSSSLKHMQRALGETISTFSTKEIDAFYLNLLVYLRCYYVWGAEYVKARTRFPISLIYCNALVESHWAHRCSFCLYLHPLRIFYTLNILSYRN